MDTKQKQEGEQQTYVIPVDMMVEMAEIILRAKLPHEITGVNENKGQIILSIRYNMDLDAHDDAERNIRSLLKAYHEICSDESEAINWRES